MIVLIIEHKKIKNYYKIISKDMWQFLFFLCTISAWST